MMMMMVTGMEDTVLAYSAPHNKKNQAESAAYNDVAMFL